MQYKLDGRAWNVLYLENHDHPRIISRYGSEHFRRASGKTLAVSYLFQKGTPFIYQGQEIGMLNWKPVSPDMYEDVHTKNHYANRNLKNMPEERLRKLWRSSRDSARTPVQWDDSENAGFTTGIPWFYVNENYKEINVAAEEKDPDSLLNFYRKAIALRKTLKVVREGTYKEHFHSNSKLYVYSRECEGQKLLVICSFANRETKMKCPREFDLTSGKIILQSHNDSSDNILKPYESRVYLWE